MPRTARAGHVVPLADVWRPGEPFTSDLRDKRVSLEGRFADDDFRVTRDDGSTWLVTPFVIGDHALLVVRGEGDARAGERRDRARRRARTQ